MLYNPQSCILPSCPRVGIKVILILIEGLSGWYEEWSRGSCILVSCPHQGIEMIVCPDCLEGDLTLYSDEYPHQGVWARPYTPMMVTALPDDSFHDTKSRG